MVQFFIKPEQIEGDIARIVGKDVNHIKNVLRMNVGEELMLETGSDWSYLCRIREFTEDGILLDVTEEHIGAKELPVEITLYQGLPKFDKMELIIQKATELGAIRIVPVACRRCVVKLDEKKGQAKIKRWQMIAEAAAKQSKRGNIPVIENILSFREAVQEAADSGIKLIPYELAEDMQKTREILSGIKPGDRVAIFIGPEGGFSEEEIREAGENGFRDISLGKRILRTETAGFALLSYLMIQLSI